VKALKPIKKNEVALFCKKIKDSGKKIVFTNGCFDILHLGHVTYLAQARALGDFLFLGVNSDASVKRLKGQERPVQCESDRAAVLLALKSIDAVCIFEEDTPLELIKLVQPDILVKGGDWDISKIVGKDFVESYGGRCQSLAFVPGHSTSSILEKIKKL
jgi:D-beta-D-heptose 7-phosphate kinase/D-beta-D-heptose 1-phosphate adenosyltransferase